MNNKQENETLEFPDGSIQTWKDGLKFEKSQMKMADDLYRFFYGQFEDFNIKRWKYQGEGKIMQQSEVDVSLTFDNKVKRISEKFRTTDFGDMYIEIYNNMDSNKFDASKKGWALRRNLSDLIYYYTPETIYCIQTKELLKVVEELMKDPKIIKYIHKNFDKDIIPNRLGFYWKNMDIPLSIVKNYTDASKSDNISIGICIPWILLVEEGCEVKIITKEYYKDYIITNIKKEEL